MGPPCWVTASCAAVASAVLAWAVGPAPVLVLFVALAVLGVLLAFVDLAVQRLPTTVVLPALAVSIVLLAVVAAGNGAWGTLGAAVLGALVLTAIFLVLYAIPGGNLGFGDVQLAALLGLFLGWLGWAQVLWGALLPWLVNAPVVLILLALRRVNRRTRVPFGPAMLVGALLAVALPAALARL